MELPARDGFSGRTRSLGPDPDTLKVPDHDGFSGRNPKRLRPLSTFDGEISAPGIQQSSLCATCSSIDFESFFDTQPYSDRELGCLKDVFNSATCPFCSLISQAAAQNLSQDDLKELPALICGVRKETRESEMHEGPGISAYAWKDSSPKFVGRLFVFLERCSDKVHSTTWRVNGSIMRQPIPPVFHHSRAKFWLDADVFKDCASERFANASLSGLIRLGCFRVFDVRSKKVVSLSSYERYIALSYVWGKAMPQYLTSLMQDFDDQNDGTQASYSIMTTEHSKLPAAIDDAVKLVTGIGERYLWIDALCIDQQDPEDKALVISQMAAIYENALLTIVAADGNGADEGLSRFHSANASESPADVGTMSLLPRADLFESAIEASAWDGRAWTYQERYLSRRCIIFTKHEVLFKGVSCKARESYTGVKVIVDSQLPANLSWIGWGEALEKINHKQHAFHEWSHRSLEAFYAHLIVTFTPRKLTYAGDRLAAIAGLLEGLYPPDLPYGHKSALSGLLSGEHFFSCLSWTSRGPRQRVPRDATGTRALPSWSWVGWTGEVLLWPTERIGSTVQIFPQIIDASNIKCVENSDADPRNWWPGDLELNFENLSYGKHVTLHLWKPLIKCSMTIERIWTMGYVCEITWLQSTGVERDFGRGIIDASDVPELENEEVLTFLLLDDIGVSSMIVKEIGTGDQRYFERVTSVCRWLQGAPGIGELDHHRLPEPEEMDTYFTYVRLT